MDAAYEAYKKKCKELGINPSPKEKIFADEIKSSSGSHHEDITEISRQRTRSRIPMPKQTKKDTNSKDEDMSNDENKKDILQEHGHEPKRYITVERAKEFVVEAYRRGYEDHQHYIEEDTADISLTDLLQTK